MTPPWRGWTRNVLGQDTTLALLVPIELIFPSGTLVTRPSKTPFITFALGPDTPRTYGDDVDVSRLQDLDIWAHDDAQSYERIEEVLDEVKRVLLEARPPEGAYPARSLGRSADLSDPELQTLKKHESFSLAWRVK